MTQGCVICVHWFDTDGRQIALTSRREMAILVENIDTDGAGVRHNSGLRQDARRRSTGDMTTLSERRPAGQWVQTERAAHEAWATLIQKAPKAAQLMHILTARVGEHNAVVVSQKTLSSMMKCSRRTVQRAVDVLVEDRWIEVRQIGENGTVNAHIINDRVAWSGKRDGIRYSLFSASVIVSDLEQPDAEDLGQQPPLRRLPSLFRDEGQLPGGDGLPPPSQPFLDGMEPDLPTTTRADAG